MNKLVFVSRCAKSSLSFDCEKNGLLVSVSRLKHFTRQAILRNTEG